MAGTKEEDKVTIICWKCDRKFGVLLPIVKKKLVVYWREDDTELGSRLARPKTYVVPCPYCEADNEVAIP